MAPILPTPAQTGGDTNIGPLHADVVRADADQVDEPLPRKRSEHPLRFVGGLGRAGARRVATRTPLPPL